MARPTSMRLLILAYTRLFLLPSAPTARKLTVIADFGAYDAVSTNAGVPTAAGGRTAVDRTL